MQVGTSSYCQLCGARLEGAAGLDAVRGGGVDRAGDGPRAMDIRPGRRLKGAPVVAPVPPARVDATVLHGRAGRPSGRVMDLRRAAPGKPGAADTVATGRSTVPVDAKLPVGDDVEAGAKPAKPAPRTWIEAQAEPDAASVAHHHELPAAPPKSTTHERHLAHFEDRFKRARGVARSQQISRWGGAQSGAEPATDGAGTAPNSTHTAPLPALHLPELPGAVVTQHQAMARLATPAPPAQPTPRAELGWRPHLSLSPHAGQYAAVAAAVAVMGGYIWLQNYPKMAIESAGSKAGVAASMPGYVPSSYSLASTNTSSGLITLNFTSPSQPGTLTVKQQRTTWDSVSLLDEYVGGQSSYTAVQGQGLTIYLYGQNQATWVNHGVWYNIVGATRLSRDQVLKIAYSL